MNRRQVLLLAPLIFIRGVPSYIKRDVIVNITHKDFNEKMLEIQGRMYYTITLSDGESNRVTIPLEESVTQDKICEAVKLFCKNNPQVLEFYCYHVMLDGVRVSGVVTTVRNLKVVKP